MSDPGPPLEPFGGGWAPTAALFRTAALASGLALLAVMLRRPDLLYLAAPIALAAAFGLRPRRPDPPRAAFSLTEDVPLEGAELRAQVQVLAQGADVVAIAVPVNGWVQPLAGRTGVVAGRPDGAGIVDLSVPLTARRWGRHRVGPAVVTVTAAGGLLRWGPQPLPERTVRVLPLAERFVGAADVPQARGSVGVHRSLRPGEGSELSGIRAFGAGDRLRRINWRVSLRAGELHVNATVAERDAEVVVFLDGRYDAGASGGIDGAASGIDIGVRAAAALARFYLQLGDRVRLITHGERVLSLPAAAGRRQLTRMLDALLDVRAPHVRTGEPEIVDPVGLDPRALVILLSPLVGVTVFDRAAALTRMGHPLVVVDTLPADATPPVDSDWTDLALRIWRLQRSAKMHRLAELGVPIVAWQGTGSLDVVLRNLARAGSVPRVRP
ncbi:MAG: DUF58 domain-containing protein [Geodermatophilaceae bacterium]|nr:DUF58 domain-containing protein [Geodermatophilaceae bacterium]